MSRLGVLPLISVCLLGCASKPRMWTVSHPEMAGRGLQTERGGKKAPEEYFHAADKAMLRNHLDEAQRALQEAHGLLTENDPRWVNYYERMGLLSYLQDQIPKAKALYLDAIHFASVLGVQGHAVADSYLGMGLCLAAEDKPREAEGYLRKALETGPAPGTTRRVEKELRRLREGKP
ncbi:MAG: tetratricopeptide repeat protein [Elusimicrobiota bacterium]